MAKSKYLALANKNLSNNFIGEKKMGNSAQNLVAAVSDMFGFTAKNEATVPVNVAIFPAYFDTIRTAGGKIDYKSTEALNAAGHQIDAVIDEGTYAMTRNGTDLGNITIAGTDTTKTIRDLLAYLKTYPKFLAKMVIHSANPEAYNRKLKLTYVNPFNDAEKKPVDLNQYFDTAQYQDTKIILDFSGVDFPVTPDLLLSLNIPGQTTVGIDMFFR